MFEKRIYFIFILALLISACSSTSTTTVTVAPVTFQPSADAQDQESRPVIDSPFSLLIGEIEPVKSLDPLFAQNSASQRAISLIYEGLTNLDEKGNPHPALAKSWTVSPDSMTYTFLLRSNAFYHDDMAFTSGFGRPISSADVVYVFNRMASRSVPEDAANLFRNYIRGFDAYVQQTRKSFFRDELILDGIRGIEAPNDSTVTFRLNRPNKTFLELLAHPFASVYPREVISRHDRGLHNNPVGTGVFSMSHVSGDSLITLERNFNHYQPERVAEKLTSINIKIYRDERTLFRNMAAGIVNYIPHIGPQTAETIVNNGELMVSYTDTFELISLGESQFFLHYLPTNALGYPLNQTRPILGNIAQKDLRGSVLADIRLQTTPEEPLSSLQETLMIGFFPEPFIEHTAKTTLSGVADVMDVKMYAIRIPNIDLALFWSPSEFIAGTETQLVAAFSHKNYGLIHKNLQGINRNHHNWWVGLDALMNVSN